MTRETSKSKKKKKAEETEGEKNPRMSKNVGQLQKMYPVYDGDTKKIRKKTSNI